MEVVEHRARAVPGVAWAELDQEDPPVLRVLLAPDADAERVRRAVTAVAPSVELQVEGEPVFARPAEEPRARLVDLSVGMKGQASAEVRLDWRGKELRGRGRGKATASGRCWAAAEAVADAMRPVIEADVRIEGVYETDIPGGRGLLVASVRVAGERFVGAVFRSDSEDEMSGARAVLDALNRRLPRIAGRSGYF
jgi:hypothetical protein